MNTAKIYLLNTLISLLAACNSNTEKAEESKSISPKDSIASTVPLNEKDTTIGGCYSQAFNRDTVTMQIEVKEKNVTGPLTYRLYEKDQNDGSIKAVLEDSIIRGWYLFRSEGVLSVRQVAWRVKPGQLWPAMGEIIQRNDTTMFAKPDQLRFESSKPLIKVSCTL